MTSNCEGHIGTANFTQKDHPILRFRLKERFVETMKAICSQQQQKIDSTVDSAIDKRMTKVRHGWDQLRENVYFIDVDSRIKRTSVEMEPYIENWFNETVAAYEQIDCGLVTLLT